MTASSNAAPSASAAVAVLKMDRDSKRFQIVGVPEQPGEVLEPYEPRGQPEGVLKEQRLVEGLPRRPDKEDDGDDELRRHQ